MVNIGQFTHKEQQLMREPKFRIWDRYKNEMVYGGFQLWFDGHGELKDTPPIGAYPNIEILEYTGLNDKHGKEIFEGDIVGYSYDNRNGFYKIYRVEIGEQDHYIEGINHTYYGVQFIEIKGSDVDSGFYSTDLKDLEVIGNIYENPELLPKDEGV
jgi:hypothetical protein